MPKVIIFTEIGGFYIPNIVAWHLIIHNGWKVFDTFDECLKTDNSESTLVKCEYQFSDTDFYHINAYDKEIRTNPELVAAFEYWNPDEFKCVDIPDGIEWYIDEGEMGGESVHEEHRIWL